MFSETLPSESGTMLLLTLSDTVKACLVRLFQNLEKIIVRDFYPDLPKLYAQEEYLMAVDMNDIEKLREIQAKYGQKTTSEETPSIYSTPATFETPAHGHAATPHRPADETNSPSRTELPEKDKDDDKKSSDVDLSLDHFLARNTSEDNASFSELMKENEQKHRAKHAWLFDKEQLQDKEQEQNLALPNIEKQAIDSGKKPTNLQTWTYKPHNSLMYVPDGVDKSDKERVEEMKLKQREILHSNTRFSERPHDQRQSRECIAQAANARALAVQGKIGADGREILPERTPTVNGYGFMGTPSPAPGVAESPLMTWGMIEDTPYRLDGGATPGGSRTPGPVFHIPEVPKRDRIALELVERASKTHRAKKQEALKRVTASFTSPGMAGFGSTPKTDRLSHMSPAAQRLASSRLRISSSDKALKASYTPSPAHVTSDKTPVRLTPRGHTPHSVSVTPRSTPKRDGSEVTSLTDNLLSLPKRQKAEEFF
ncbi:hypothetical protein LSAT2_029695 [Lamellibrachia satsuma]|nr:hypothetical protein LSAT2_029695 [Lamellibrachia satsuma]